MQYDLKYPSIEKVVYYAGLRGMTTRELSKQFFGDEKTKRDIVYQMKRRRDLRASTLVKICSILDISMDSLFQNSDESWTVKSNVVPDEKASAEIALLKAKIDAQQKLLDEKDLRINDLKKVLNDLALRIDSTFGLVGNTTKENAQVTDNL